MAKQTKSPLSFHAGNAELPIVIAHRGGSLEAPENTLRACQMSVALGVPWIEVDVGLTRDGVATILHDDSLQRTTGHPLLLEDAHAAELAALRAVLPRANEDTLRAMASEGLPAPAPFVDDGGQDLGVPPLRAALDIAHSRYMLELKQTSRPDELLAAVGRDIERARAAERVALASFDADLLALAGKRLPHLPQIGVAETVAEARLMLQRPLQCLAVACAVAAEVWAIVPPHVALWVWTVYTPAQARRMALVPVDGVITDAPAAVQASFGRPLGRPSLGPT